MYNTLMVNGQQMEHVERIYTVFPNIDSAPF